MVTFDFMNDQALRNSLENDYHELEECMNVKAWKAVHVLAGSIIETLLIDFLVEIEYAKRTSTELKNINFFNMINICKNEGILTNRSAELSQVIREYRNLIHPERLIRINESVDEDSANVALSLVRMVIKDISAKRKQTYGYTAEQIVKKIEADSSVLSILTDLLKNTNENEKRQLLLKAIPQKYLSLWNTHVLPLGDTQLNTTLATLADCFHYTFEAANEESKLFFAKEFLRIIKEENTEMTRIYELRFFRGSDLIYYPPHEIKIVTKHILSTLQDVLVYTDTLENIQGIGKFLGSKEIEKLVDIIMKEFISKSYEQESAKIYLDAEYQNLAEEERNMLMNRLEVWKGFYEENENMENADEVKKIILYIKLDPLGSLDNDEPF